MVQTVSQHGWLTFLYCPKAGTSPLCNEVGSQGGRLRGPSYLVAGVGLLVGGARALWGLELVLTSWYLASVLIE